jgi:tetratricopeptide (TPR) repeat protein
MTKRLLYLLADLAPVILFAGLTVTVLGVNALNSPNTPTGGDAGSHVLYAWEYSRSLLFSGKILPWMPEVFAGFPFLSYYFPLPFMVIAILAKCIGFAPAFKWGCFAAAMLLPGAVHVVGRRWLALPWPAAFLGALGSFVFLLHEQNSIWGGNLLSSLSGEFAYSYGLLFAMLACLAWVRASAVPGGWVIAALLEAATGFSHGFTLLVVGFSSLLLFLEADDPRRTLGMLLRGHVLAFCLLGGWLWPMLEMHGSTIPNDGAFQVSTWRQLVPLLLRPVFLAGIAALPLCALLAQVRSSITPLQARAMRYLAGAAGLGVLAFVCGDRIGLANIRFLPMTWLFCAIISGWSIGFLLSGFWPARSGITVTATWLLTAALTFGTLGWLAQTVRAVPDWSLWNHAGLESKPQWHNLSKLFPAMKGTLWSPRLVFEHDPDNNDLGSTRSLEALSLFIGGRPVLEGLYMESAVTGPAIYQVQSEISEHPSSPLARFPSGALDPAFAAEHMRFLHADTLLLRSAAAKSAVEKSGLFLKIAESSPFAVYRLKQFSSRLAEVVTQPISARPLKGWMDDAYGWFRIRSRFHASLPVYGAGADLAPAPTAVAVREIQLERHRLHFETDAIGKPHLIKMAWNPRWQLRSAGKLYLAAPGFMLVVPQEKDIILEYGHTPVGFAGMAATGISLLAALFLLAKKSTSGKDAQIVPTTTPWGRFAAYWAVLLLSCFWFAMNSPERTYNRGTEALHAGRYDQAATLFQRAFAQRRQPAKKEEALFWSAKATESAGHKEDALKQYRELVTTYQGYWVPESLYNCVLFGRDLGKRDVADACAARLKEEFPNSAWRRKLLELR